MRRVSDVEKPDESEKEIVAVALRLSADGRGVIARWTCPCGYKKNTRDFFYAAYWLQCERCGARSLVVLSESKSRSGA